MSDKQSAQSGSDKNPTERKSSLSSWKSSKSSGSSLEGSSDKKLQKKKSKQKDPLHQWMVDHSGGTVKSHR
ncbi:hypothetical protein F5Y04DRAFT_281526 [Hypomontagnella monticulosa]|nr:hypothetical protein F5Y04DRAFT_281526 [Hypomontagnella monticulosa]